MPADLPYLSGPQVAELASVADCVAVLERSLKDGSIDPEADSPRLFSDFRAGELLLMPADAGPYAGVKVVTVAPGNPAAGHPKIQGVYVLFDAEHLRPLALLDAAEMTLVRTSAVTALAIRHLLAAGESGSVQRLAVMGTGPQAISHVRAVTSVVEVEEVVVIGRRQSVAADVAETLRTEGYPATAGEPRDLLQSDVIVCVTSSSVPVLADDQVAPDAVVCAVGSHGLNRREIPAALTLRSDVVVEGRASAMREAGNLIPARSVEEWSHQPLTNLAELVAGKFVRRPGHPALYSGVGMAWEDIVVAGHLYDRQLSSPATRSTP